MEKLLVIKIGGSVVDDADQLKVFLKSFAEIPHHKILIHGGGVIANQLCEKLAIPVKMIGGRRITDEATLDLVTMVYGGLINKQIVAKLQAFGCQSIGLTGADAGIIKAHRRPVDQIDYGYVGDIDEVSDFILSGFLQQGLTPVLASLSCTGDGQLLNINADTIASSVASAMSHRYQTSLVYVMDFPGVLQDVKDPSSVIAELNRQKIDLLSQQNIISKGMIPKLENGLRAKDSGVREVWITNAANGVVIDKGQKVQGTQLV